MRGHQGVDGVETELTGLESDGKQRRPRQASFGRQAVCARKNLRRQHRIVSTSALPTHDKQRGPGLFDWKPLIDARSKASLI